MRYTPELMRRRKPEPKPLDKIDEIGRALAEVLAPLLEEAAGDQAAPPSDEDKVRAILADYETAGTFARSDDGTVVWTETSDAGNTDHNAGDDDGGTGDDGANAGDKSGDAGKPDSGTAGRSLLKLLAEGTQTSDAKDGKDAKGGKDDGEWKLSDWGDPTKRAARYAEIAETKEASNG